MAHYLDLEKLAAVPLQQDPFDYLVVENFIKQDMFAGVKADFPHVPGPGSHPPSELDIHGNFAAIMNELTGKEMTKAVEKKFDIDLTNRPTMYTVRGFVREKDGQIHTDSVTKIITLLLYMNDEWDASGGRLRLLRSGDSLENPIAEVPPNGGTLLLFRRADNSWHGHKPFSGPRKTIQVNWVTSQEVVNHEQRRHGVSNKLKRLVNNFLTNRKSA